MSWITLAVLVILPFVVRTAAKFPVNPKPCQYGDTKCLEEMARFLIEQKSGGYSSLNLIQFDPLKISSIDIKQGKESPVSIDLKFRNTELLGLRSAKVIEVKGFGKDITKLHEIHLRPSYINLVGDYTISGRILILPIQGNGKCNITLKNADVATYFNGAPQVKPDGTYLIIKRANLTISPKRVYFKFENLFNGDKALGDNMNSFLNENWEDIYSEVNASIENAFLQIFKSIIGNVFQKYPYDKFFTME